MYIKYHFQINWKALNSLTVVEGEVYPTLMTPLVRGFFSGDVGDGGVDIADLLRP